MRSTQKVTIEAPTEVIGSSGGRTSTWLPVSGLADLPATVMPVLREADAADMTVLEDQYQIRLAGPYPAITTAMRVLDGAAAYDIRKVRVGPFAPRKTLLDAVKVSI